MSLNFTKLFRVIPLLITIIFGSADAYANTFRVCTVEIPNALTADKKGPQPLFELYQELIKLVVQDSEQKFDLIFAPSARCMELFERKQIDMIWPFIIVEDKDRIKNWNEGILPIYSMPIIMGGHYIITRETDPKLSSVKELEGKTVVRARGYGVPKDFEDNPRIKELVVNRNGLIPEMLLRKRVDAGILQTGWVQTLNQQGLLKGLHHGKIIDFWGGAFTFQPTEEGKEMASRFSTAVLKLVTRGVYNKIMKGAPYYIPAY